MAEIPGVVSPTSESEIQERWADTPVGKVRYFTDKEGQIIQDRRSSDVVTNFRLAKLELGHGQISKQLELNTALTQQVVDILQSTRMLVSIIKFIAMGFKWFTAIATGMVLAYSLVKGKPSLPNITIFDGE